MLKNFAKFFYILALLGLAFALVMLYLGGWNGTVGIVVGGGAAALFVAVGLLFQIIAALVPKGPTGLVQAGIGFLLIGAIAWAYETWLSNGGQGSFILPLSLVYIPALVIGAVVLAVGIGENRKRKSKD